MFQFFRAAAATGLFIASLGLADVTAPATLTLEADVARLVAADTAGAEEDCLANAV